MKKTILLAIIFLAGAACSRNGFIETVSTPVEFVSDAISTKVVMTQDGNVISAKWSETDTIGIYCSSSQRGNFPYKAGIPDPKTPDYARFTATDQNRMFTYDGKACTYYAYTPYSAGFTNNPAEISFTVPAVQTQNSDSLEDLQRACLFTASPVSVSGDDARVVFQFTPALPIVQLRMKMDDATAIQVPVRKVRLISTDADLCADGTLDITGSPASFAASSGSKEILLQTPVLALDKSQGRVASFVTLPGTHSSLKAEITAIDNSVFTADIPGVTFRPGCNYVSELTLSLGGFVEAEPFDVTATTLECKAGESLKFNISGVASCVDFWSGEEFHDYAYSDKVRKVASPEMTSFLHALSAGDGNGLLSTKVSTDFNGKFTESDILSAHWTDISEHFTFAKEVLGSSNPITSNSTTYNQYFVNSGEYDIAPYFDGKEQMYFAFFWHVDAINAEGLNTRTASYLTKLKIGTQYYMTQDNIELVSGSTLTGTAPGWMTPKTSSGVPADAAFRFFCDFRPAVDMEAYAVIKTPLKPTLTDYGKDTPFAVQAAGDDTPKEYSYTFGKPGTYTVVFVASCPSLSGDRTVTRTFTVNVTE